MAHSNEVEQRAFVAGATGLTGRLVVEHLAVAGVSTVAHVRPDSGRLAHWRESFGALGASVSTAAWQVDAMTEALTEIRPTVVFGLLGTTKKRSRSGDGDYESVDYGLTACLIDACERLSESPKPIAAVATPKLSRLEEVRLRIIARIQANRAAEAAVAAANVD